MYGIDPTQLLNAIICPTLIKMGDKDWQNSAKFLLGIAAVETQCGRYLTQLEGGPAKGLYQLEPASERDLWSYLNGRPGLRRKVEQFSVGNDLDSLGNLHHQTAVARAFLMRIPQRIPQTLLGWAGYWKQYWNTEKGKGTVSEFIEKYPKAVRLVEYA